MASASTPEYRNACRRCVRELRGKNLDSQFDFRRWALRAHPDKGGSVQEFQRISECVDMVYRDACLEQIRDWDRGRRSVNDLARTETIVASIIQTASACHIDSVGIELEPWIGRRNFVKQGQTKWQHLRGATARVGHKRIVGIPLRLYSELEARLHLDRKNKPVLLSIGPNWTVPWTKGHLSLNISSTSTCNSLYPYLQPKSLDLRAKLKISALKLEAGYLLQHPTRLPSQIKKVLDVKPTGLSVGMKLEVIHVSAKEGVRLGGFRIGGRRKGKEEEPKDIYVSGDSSSGASSGAASQKTSQKKTLAEVPVGGEVQGHKD